MSSFTGESLFSRISSARRISPYSSACRFGARSLRPCKSPGDPWVQPFFLDGAFPLLKQSHHGRCARQASYGPVATQNQRGDMATVGEPKTPAGLVIHAKEHSGVGFVRSVFVEETIHGLQKVAAVQEARLALAEKAASLPATAKPARTPTQTATPSPAGT
jgi:hypothetical protein